MITALISRLVILAFGTLYPAYASYKAVRTKDVKEYVKWMMYWIIFALFTCAETFTDVLFSFWFPFYYEIKIALVIWLLSPATNGSSFLYKSFVHPALLKREDEIDEMLSKAKERGYSTVVNLGTRGVTYATNVILQTAMKGGGGLVEHIRKSYSLSDLGPPQKAERFLRRDEVDAGPVYEEDEEIAPMPNLRHRPPGSSPVDMRFKEVDVNVRQFRSASGPLKEVQSTEDISSGYSSTDQLFSGQSELALSRTPSVTSRGRGRPTRATQAKRAPLAEEMEDDEEGDYSPEHFYDLSPTESYPIPPFSAPSIVRKFSGQEGQLSLPQRPLSVALETQSNLLGLPEFSNLSSSQSSLASSSSDKSERKGRYRKLPAPRPPVDPHTSSCMTSKLAGDFSAPDPEKLAASQDAIIGNVSEQKDLKQTVDYSIKAICDISVESTV